MSKYQTISISLIQYFFGIYGFAAIGYILWYITGFFPLIILTVLTGFLTCFFWRDKKYGKSVWFELWVANGALWLNIFSLILGLVLYFVD